MQSANKSQPLFSGCLFSLKHAKTERWICSTGQQNRPDTRELLLPMGDTDLLQHTSMPRSCCRDSGALANGHPTCERFLEICSTQPGAQSLETAIVWCQQIKPMVFRSPSANAG